MINVIMIEDDAEFAELITEYLASFKIKVTNFTNPSLALEQNFHNYHCMIADLTLPEIDGLEVVKEVRKKYDLPIIISSARSDTMDKVLGLNIGADDYLAKPYEPSEMRARIESLVRRYQRSMAQFITNENSRFKVDSKKEVILFDDKEYDLTRAEYEIMRYFICKHGYVVSREELQNNCDSLTTSCAKTIDVLVQRIRNKLQIDQGESQFIHQVRGYGYKLLG